jgi:hypothetical protein
MTLVIGRLPISEMRNYNEQYDSQIEKSTYG